MFSGIFNILIIIDFKEVMKMIFLESNDFAGGNNIITKEVIEQCLQECLSE